MRAGSVARIGSFDPRLSWSFAAGGAAAALLAVTLDPSSARSAADQDWSPFVLVTGLLLVGLVANDDGLFAAAGSRLAHLAHREGVLFMGTSILIGVTAGLLNLDTSVAFLTPVVVYMARTRERSASPYLYACILLANAGSLFLPGSNLTNLIVFGPRHVSGATYVSHLWLAALAAFVITALVIAVSQRHELSLAAVLVFPTVSGGIGVGFIAVIAVTVVIVATSTPALPVLAVGAGVIAVRVAMRRVHLADVWNIVGVPVLVGLFGLAVALGTLGRSRSEPVDLLRHLNAWGTTGVAAVSTVLVNNLPAASFLAARTPRHPYALLVGLNIGPNLFVTGSLAWFLWLRAAHAAGARPSVARAVRIGAFAVPLSLAAAVGLLVLTGSA